MEGGDVRLEHQRGLPTAGRWGASPEPGAHLQDCYRPLVVCGSHFENHANYHCPVSGGSKFALAHWAGREVGARILIKSLAGPWSSRHIQTFKANVVKGPRGIRAIWVITCSSCCLPPLPSALHSSLFVLRPLLCGGTVPFGQGLFLGNWVVGEKIET